LCAAAGVVPPPEHAYFYAFEAGGFGFFVCDTRSGREGRERIMSRKQFAVLKHWLKGRQEDGAYGGRPKFVLSPSVVVPFLQATRGGDAYRARSDGWDGFPDSLRELFAFIARERIENVVFLCGDPHISMSSSISISAPGHDALNALCIVASPFYAPYPFANAQAQDYAGTGAIACAAAGGATMRYERAAVAAGDSFTTVSVREDGRGWRVSASVHCAAGAPIVAEFPLPPRPDS